MIGVLLLLFALAACDTRINQDRDIGGSPSIGTNAGSGARRKGLFSP